MIFLVAFAYPSLFRSIDTLFLTICMLSNLSFFCYFRFRGPFHFFTSWHVVPTFLQEPHTIFFPTFDTLCVPLRYELSFFLLMVSLPDILIFIGGNRGIYSVRGHIALPFIQDINICKSSWKMLHQIMNQQRATHSCMCKFFLQVNFTWLS